jgi:hypothetical protein
MSGNNPDGSKAFSFQINFAPQQILQEAENQLMKSMRYRTESEITAFFGETSSYSPGGTLQKTPGAGLLLIRDFLEKKFDDPKTQQRMEEFFEKNFDRIMEEAMQKALQHKANAFAFGKAKDKSHDAGHAG